MLVDTIRQITETTSRRSFRRSGLTIHFQAQNEITMSLRPFGPNSRIRYTGVIVGRQGTQTGPAQDFFGGKKLLEDIQEIVSAEADGFGIQNHFPNEFMLFNEFMSYEDVVAEQEALAAYAEQMRPTFIRYDVKF